MRNLNMGATLQNHAPIVKSLLLQFSAACSWAVGAGSFARVQVPVVVPTKELVAARIRELVQRHAEGNQSEFARLCGLDRMDVYRYLRAENMPGAEHLARVAQSCSVSVDWILGMPGAVHDSTHPTPDDKIEIPPRAVALVDFETVRRFVAGERLGNRSVAAVRLDANMRLVDATEFATVQRQLDDATKAKSRRRRRSDPAG